MREKESLFFTEPTMVFDTPSVAAALRGAFLFFLFSMQNFLMAASQAAMTLGIHCVQGGDERASVQ